MLFKNYVFIVICAILTPFSVANLSSAPFMNKQRGALMLTAGASLTAWAYAQHHYSHVAVQRYPLIQQRGAINAQLKKEQNPQIIEQLTQRLETITFALEDLQTTQTLRNIGRILAFIATCAAATGAYYSPSQDTATTTKS